MRSDIGRDMIQARYNMNIIIRNYKTIINVSYEEVMSIIPGGYFILHFDAVN